MPSLADTGGSSQEVLVGSSLMRPSPPAATDGELSIASVRPASHDWPSRPVRKIVIRVRRVELPEYFQRALDRVLELGQLPEGWNSHGAAAVSDAAFVRTVEFLSEYLIAGIAEPALVPTVRGGIQLEWHRQGVDIEVEVGAGGYVSWCAEDRRTGEEYEADLAGHEHEVRHWLKRASD